MKYKKTLLVTLTVIFASCGGGGGSAHARERLQAFALARKGAQYHHVFRGQMEISRARVITQTTPQCEYVIQTCLCERLYIGESLEKPFVIRNNLGDLRLLQHDFRQPDAIRIASVLPGKIIAAMLLLPANEARGKVLAYRVLPPHFQRFTFRHL